MSETKAGPAERFAVARLTHKTFVGDHYIANGHCKDCGVPVWDVVVAKQWKCTKEAAGHE